METVPISVSIPASLFEWMTGAVALGEFASMDEVIVAGLELLQPESRHAAQLRALAAEWEEAALYKVARYNSASMASALREGTASYESGAYDDAYFDAMETLYPNLSLTEGAAVAAPDSFRN